MSSILAMVRKGNFTIPKRVLRDAASEHKYKEATVEILNTRHVCAVNVLSVTADLINRVGRVEHFSDFTRLMPPFETMWLESFYEFPVGALLLRRHLTPAVWDSMAEESLFTSVLEKQKQYKFSGCTSVLLNFFCNIQGFVLGGSARAALLLHPDGNLLDVVVSHFPAAQEEMMAKDVVTKWVNGWFSTCFHALLRMNCANATLEPMPGSDQSERAANKRSPEKRPPIVWHEIKIGAAPVRASSRVADPERAELRSHWVRGHYADYTRGKGLFGDSRRRCVYWIPEHKSGSEEAGEVVAFYSIQSQEK